MAEKMHYLRYFSLARITYHDRLYISPSFFRRGQTRGLQHLTKEQKEIIHHAKYENVLVTAVPGSGKSTVGLEVMKNGPCRRTLMVTYSKQLQSETFSTAKRLGLGNRPHIYTIHSLAGKIFGRLTRDDIDLITGLDQADGTKFYKNAPLDLDQIIIDEVQDLTPFYYSFLLLFIKMITRKVGKPPRLLLLGDAKQSIFDYNGGDARFLTMGEMLFQDCSPYGWRHLEMTQSHRFGTPLAEFVNSQLDDSTPRIQGSSRCPQNKPLFLPVDVWNPQKLAKTLISLIDEYGLENVAILASSTRPKTPAIRLANELSRLGYPIAGAPSDGVKYTVKTKMNKLEIASVHSYKGRERDLVIYFVDGTYYEYYGRDRPENVLPNDIYVAYTRPKKQLVLLHHHRNPLLPIMPPSKIKATCEIVNPDRLGFSVPYRRRGISTGIRIPSECVRVADILKNIAPHDLFHVLGRIQIQRIHRKAGPISKPKDVMTKHDDRELYEPVDDFVRTATIASFEHVKTGRCTSLGYGLGEKEVPAIPGTPKQRARWFATEAIKYDSERHNYMARKLQMDGNKCDWLRKVLPQTDVRLGKHIGNTPSEFSFGRQVSTRVDVDGKVLSLGGPIDIVQQPLDGCPPILHEIKFDLKLPREAHLQVAIYGYVWAVTHGMSELPEMKVFNIRNGETWEVRSTIEAVKEIIQHLARKKYGYGNKMSDPEFLAECNEIKGKADSLLGSSIPVIHQKRSKKRRSSRRKL